MTEEMNNLQVVSVRLVKEAGISFDRKIHSMKDAVKVIKEYISDYDREVFCVLNLKTDGSVINVSMVSQGTLNQSLVHIREVFKCSILSNAASIITFHNHPSGDITPSTPDYETTQKIKKAGELIGIPLLDHIIVGAENEHSYSFLEHDELDKGHPVIRVKEKEEMER